MVALVSANPPKIEYYLWLIILKVKSGSTGLLHQKSHPSMSRETNIWKDKKNFSQ